MKKNKKSNCASTDFKNSFCIKNLEFGFQKIFHLSDNFWRFKLKTNSRSAVKITGFTNPCLGVPEYEIFSFRRIFYRIFNNFLFFIKRLLCTPFIWVFALLNWNSHRFLILRGKFSIDYVPFDIFSNWEDGFWEQKPFFQVKFYYFYRWSRIGFQFQLSRRYVNLH